MEEGTSRPTLVYHYLLRTSSHICSVVFAMYVCIPTILGYIIPSCCRHWGLLRACSKPAARITLFGIGIWVRFTAVAVAALLGFRPAATQSQ